MMNVGFIQNGNNVKTGHKNNNNACVRDMQIEHPVNTLGQPVLKLRRRSAVKVKTARRVVKN
jgi:hypothetical protein